MKLQNYLYQCDSCSNQFKIPELLGEPYGEFLLRDQLGNTAYLDAINSSVFKEVSSILKNNENIKPMKDMVRATILHEIFGLACDLSSDNSEYKIGGKPVCPKCHSNKMYSWEPIYPPEIVDISIPEVTHKRWNKLNEIEKASLINAAVDEILENKDRLRIF